MAFKLEKDVMLIAVALKTSVHVFEHSEEEEIPLSHVSMIVSSDITSLEFVDYNLIMIQDLALEDHVKIMCWDPDTGTSEAISKIERDPEDAKVRVQAGSQSVYFTLG